MRSQKYPTVSLVMKNIAAVIKDLEKTIVITVLKEKINPQVAVDTQEETTDPMLIEMKSIEAVEKDQKEMKKRLNTAAENQIKMKSLTAIQESKSIAEKN